MKNNRHCILLILAVLVSSCSCDPQRLNECEWYLVPEPKDAKLIEPGWVSLCARNYQTNRQKCYLKAKLKFAEDIYGKPIRLSEMEVDKNEFPRTILKAKPCKPKRKP